MEKPSPKRKRLIDRLDRGVREMNAFLLVLAIGLAALDVTGFVACDCAVDGVPLPGSDATETVGPMTSSECCRA